MRIVKGPAPVVVRDDRHELAVYLRQIRKHIELFPELSLFYHHSVETDLQACLALFEFNNNFIPLFHDQSKETQRRRLLANLKDAVPDVAYRNSLDIEVAKSNLRSGVPDRARTLGALDRQASKNAALIDDLEFKVAEYEKYYGAVAGLIPSLDIWEGMKGDVRGRSLVDFFRANEKFLNKKRVLHACPEGALQSWIRAEQPRLACEYVTLNAFGDADDLKEDLTALTILDQSFDLVICHRVLEHVLDDSSAIREIHRILKPGGVLSVSVPQSMQLEVSNEWIIPDTTHDHHIRQYGRDFSKRLEDAGFRVQVETLLLNRAMEDHLALGTYPMRIYSCIRIQA